MNQVRRNLLCGSVSTAVLSVAVAAGVLSPGKVFAARAHPAFWSTLNALHANKPNFSEQIELNAPDIAADGVAVFISFSTSLPDVDMMIVSVDNNPQPIIAVFNIKPELAPALEMRIKFAQSSDVSVIARSGGQFYRTAKSVRVTSGGCGAGLN
jgi:sulfur-oxidizing protein SoxY